MNTLLCARTDFDAVVVGASAGGVSALQTLTSRLPADFGIPVFVVLHVPRDRPNGLSELLGARCALPVSEAEDKQTVTGGNVVIAPPDYHLLIETRESVALSVDAPVLFSRPAIDVLFESAACVFGARLLAILLTGASTDGSEGVAAVRAVGGSVWIQDPADATAPLMPAAAIAHAGADAVLTLEQICLALENTNT